MSQESNVAADPESGNLELAKNLQEKVKSGDFRAVLDFMLENREALTAALSDLAIKDELRKSTRDRLNIAVIEAAGFGKCPAEDALLRMDKLLRLNPGTWVVSESWGMGKVVRADPYYLKVIIDFKKRKRHQMTFDAACESLEILGADHVLVELETAPEAIAAQINAGGDGSAQGELLAKMLCPEKGFGEVTVSKLEDLFITHGFAKLVDKKGKEARSEDEHCWKLFWTVARKSLEKAGRICVPKNPKDEIKLIAPGAAGSAAAESDETAAPADGERLTELTAQTDPKEILASLRSIAERRKKAQTAADADKDAMIRERATYAMRVSLNSNDALYAQLAMVLDELKLDPAAVEEARGRMWQGSRFLAAAKALPVRDLQPFVRFLAPEAAAERRANLFASFDAMNFAFAGAVLAVYKNDDSCGEAVAELLKRPDAPATLVTHIVARYRDFAHWEKLDEAKRLPRLVVILMHAIALGEGRQSGEMLSMQNRIRKLFYSKEWLEEMLDDMAEPADKVLFFERFQASTSWEHSTHATIVARMCNKVPELKNRRRKTEKKTVAAPANLTSPRSYAQRTAEYEKLVNETIPQNARDIELARSYGDLRENFEYQAAKEQQKVLLNKSTVMGRELAAMKTTDFANVDTAHAMPGTMVEIEKPDGSAATYAILGEWDNDPALNILSSRTPLAVSMIGKEPGESFEMRNSDGELVTAKIKAVLPLAERIREWMKEVPAAE